MAAALSGSIVAGGALSACSNSTQNASTSASTSNAFGGIELDEAKWGYDSDNDLYYQVGVTYCAAPVDTSYECMGIYVPGKYMNAQDNGDGTYTCKPDASSEVNGFTAETAPIVMPINTAGYSAQQGPSEYSYDSSIGTYLQAGFVYVFAGCRGRNNGTDDSGNFKYSGGAPWGVTDLKSAVRSLRYNSSKIPGDKDRIFSFGMSGGGAQSCLLGVTGDAVGYMQYLDLIGAPMQDASGKEISDAIFGSMCWCPITCLDEADAAYEWNMGQYSTDGTRAQGTFTKQLSNDMAAEYAAYINKLNLTDAEGNKLQLAETTGDAICAEGTYYDYVKSVLEGSLNNFLKDTEFPYTPSSRSQADLGAAGGGGQGGDGSIKGGQGNGGPGQNGEKPSGEMPSGNGGKGGAPGGMPGGSDSGSSSESVTYETVEDYIAALNEDETWVKYDSSTNTATITSIGAFSVSQKTPSKDVGAFDALDRSQGENALFGNDENDSLHFDYTMKKLLNANADEYAKLENWDSSYPDAYSTDINLEDSLGNPSQVRQDLYNPLYYLLESYYDGAGTSTPAKNWRIRTGICQGDTANTTDINLALALQSALGEKQVDFETVWGQGHTTAERTGDSTTNFIEWVQECCK